MSKHTKLIEVWKNGADIQILTEDGWKDIEFPSWNEDVEYRIKPNRSAHFIAIRKDDIGICGHFVGPFNYYTDAIAFTRSVGGGEEWTIVELHNPADVPTQGRGPVEPL